MVLSSQLGPDRVPGEIHILLSRLLELHRDDLLRGAIVGELDDWHGGLHANRNSPRSIRCVLHSTEDSPGSNNCTDILFTTSSVLVRLIDREGKHTQSVLYLKFISKFQ